MRQNNLSLRRMLTPAGLQGWLRGRLAPAALRYALTRKLLGRAGWRYVYDQPEPRPAAEGADICFSIAMAAGDAAPALLETSIASVQRQWHGRLELLVAVNGTTGAAARACLGRLQDRRIRVLDTAGASPVVALDAALAACAGCYVVLLAPGDELTPDCLQALAAAAHGGEADFLYSDEDEIAGRGRYRKPWFKPDWSPDLLMSLPYVMHVACVRRDLLAQAGRLRPEHEGAEIWDLLLRITEKAQRIVHVPRVLYHRRAAPPGGAARARTAGQKARLEALARRGQRGELEAADGSQGYGRLRRHVLGEPLVSIIIPSRNNGAVLQACVDSIRQKSTWRSYELVLLDNGSDDEGALATFSRLAADGATVIRHDAPFNYSELNNLGARRARGALLLFLNDDTEVLTPDWLERMAGFAQAPHVGAVGAMLLYPGRRSIQHIGVINTAVGPLHACQHADPGSPGYFFRHVLEHNWLAVTGACLMVARDRFDAVGGFDESLPVAYNDIDLCMRLYAAGYYNVSSPAVRLVHHESASRGHDAVDAARRARLELEREKLYAAHPQFRSRDPFLNPNLGQASAWFDLRPASRSRCT